MPDFSPMGDGSESELSSCEEDELEDELEQQASSSKEDGSVYLPSSSEDDESDDEPRQRRRRHKISNDIQSPQDFIVLNHNHLRDDTDLEAGTVISIGETLELHDGSFLMTTKLEESKNGHSVKFFGYIFKPIEDFDDYLPVEFGGSELVWICEATEHDPKPEGYQRCASSEDVLRIRHLVFTNSGCAPGSFPQSQATGTFTDPRSLVFQWKLLIGLSNLQDTRKERGFKSILKGGQEQPKAFVAMSNQELFVGGTMAADLPHSQHQLDSDAQDSSMNGPRQPQNHQHALGRNLGRGTEHRRDARERLVLAPNTNSNRVAKLTRNSAIRKSPHHLEMSLTRPLKNPSVQRTTPERGIEQQTYTFADAFCGAGGMSIGARAAGLSIEWAFDEDGDAVDTYSLNHGEDVCKQISAQTFLKYENAYGTSKVDILHLSPPCQGFSLASRGFPNNGETDNKCMTYVGDIVEKVRPRIVTLEQVSRVLSRYRQYFKTVVHDLTSIGYNVRWRIIQCADFGVPQKRRRLFMIASCRGEPLPEFPKPTHAHHAYCDELRLQPWNTFGGAVDNLEDSAPNHLLQYPRRVRRIENWKPSNLPTEPYHGTVTTGQSWPDHYSGKYVCTPREAACLQGFPAGYEFCGSRNASRKQVANAVPPPVAKAILEEVKRSLMRTDASKRS